MDKASVEVKLILLLAPGPGGQGLMPLQWIDQDPFHGEKWALEMHQNLKVAWRTVVHDCAPDLCRIWGDIPDDRVHAYPLWVRLKWRQTKEWIRKTPAIILSKSIMSDSQGILMPPVMSITTGKFINGYFRLRSEVLSVTGQQRVFRRVPEMRRFWRLVDEWLLGGSLAPELMLTLPGLWWINMWGTAGGGTYHRWIFWSSASQSSIKAVVWSVVLISISLPKGFPQKCTYLRFNKNVWF